MDGLLAPLAEKLTVFAEALTGREGLTPAEQAAQLQAAAHAVGALTGAMDELTIDDAVAQLAAVQRSLETTAQFAVDRDFDAHMAAKAAAGDGALASLTGDGFVTPNEVVGDFLAASLSGDLDSE